jgi:hypothetical protein
MYHDEVKRVRDAMPAEPVRHEQYFEYQKRVLEADWPFFEFLSAKFPFDEDRRDVDMAIVNTVFPLSPLDEYFNSPQSGRHRAFLNGALVEFADFWANTEFFWFKDGASQLMDFAPQLESLTAENVMSYTGLFRDAEIFSQGRTSTQRELLADDD